MRLTKSEVEEAIATIYGLLAEGKDDKEVLEGMGISAEDYAALKAAMFDKKADEVRTRPIEHVYVEYCIQQAQNVKDLTDLMETYKGSRQANALVGAIRVRSEIYDKLIKTGQDMGVIKRAAQQHEVIGGIVVADLTNEKLKALITQELRELSGLMKKYGDKGILEMDPGTLHYGPALPAKTSASGEDDKDKPVTSPAPVARIKTAMPLKAGAPAPDSKFAKAASAKAKTGRRVVKTDLPVREVPLLKATGLR